MRRVRRRQVNPSRCIVCKSEREVQDFESVRASAAAPSSPPPSPQQPHGDGAVGGAAAAAHSFLRTLHTPPPAPAAAAWTPVRKEQLAPAGAAHDARLSQLP